MVSYTDQSVYSKAESWISGSEWLHSKYKLPTIAPEAMPQHFEINEGKWVGAMPDPAQGPFFVKDGLRNWATGIMIVKSVEECLEVAEDGKHYVVQPSIKDQLLIDGCKMHVRFYFVLLSPVGTTKFEAHYCRHAVIAKAHKTFNVNDMDKMCQISRDRHMTADRWEHYEVMQPKICDLIADVITKCRPKLQSPTTKSSFDLFGADIMVDSAMRPWLLEVNRSPLVKDDDLWLLHGVLNLAIPEGPPPQGPSPFLLEWCRLELSPEPPSPPSEEVAQKALAQTGMQAEVQMADFARQLPVAAKGGEVVPTASGISELAPTAPDNLEVAPVAAETGLQLSQLRIHNSATGEKGDSGPGEQSLERQHTILLVSDVTEAERSHCVNSAENKTAQCG